MSLTGCGKKKAAHSGFLGDYSQLEADARLEGALVYINPRRGLADFDRVMVSPVGIHFAPNAEGIGIDPVKLAELTQYATEHLRAMLAQRYQVVDSPGPGVLHFRAALTDIKKADGAWNILPQTKLMGVGLGGASMEAEAVDSITGERIVAVVDTRSGERLSLEGLGGMDHAKQAIRYWIDDLKRRIEQARRSG